MTVITVGFGDPLVGLTEATLAEERPEWIVAAACAPGAAGGGAGRVAVAADLRRAAQSLRLAFAECGTGAQLVQQRPPAWGAAPPGDCSAIAAIPARPGHRWVAVWGAVRRPVLAQVPAGLLRRDLLALAGGAASGTVLLGGGGALNLRPLTPGAPVGADGPHCFVVLPERHSLVARLQRSLAVDLRAAAAACSHCYLCTAACPAGADPAGVLLALGHRRPESALPAAESCDGCGLCTTVCPAGLQPHRLLDTVRQRWAEQGQRDRQNPTPVRPAPSRQSLLARLGLLPCVTSPLTLID